MKSALEQVQTEKPNALILHWLKLVSITGGSQAVIQATGIISGILIIRLLPINEYAYYTITNTMLGTIAVLSDSGITNGIVAQSGKVWQDKEKLGIVLATGLQLRRKFATISLMISIPILVYLLTRQGASWTTCVLIVLALIPAFFASLSDSIYGIVPKLHQEIKSFQVNQLSVSLGRLLLNGLMLLSLPFTYIALLASGIPLIYGNRKLRKITNLHIKPNQQPDTQVRKEVLSIVKRTLPGAIYYCVSGQITTWLVSIFGNVNSLAQIGALGRISAILTVFLAIFNILIIPRFARLPGESNILFKHYSRILLGTILAMCITTIVIWMGSTQILWVLGDKYSGLETELVLTIGGSCLSFIAGTTFSIYSSRGWVLMPFISIPINILSVIAGILIFDISTLQGILLFNMFIALSNVLVNTSYCLFKTRRVSFVN